MSFSSKFICNICKLVLSSKPISLPCSSIVCNEHLQDGTAKDGLIRCLKCDQEFVVPQNGFPLHEMTSNMLKNDEHLNNVEKTLKQAIQELTLKLDQLLDEFKRKHSDLERKSFDHFSEIRRQINIQREELKVKIDEIAVKLIGQVNEKEKAHNLKAKNSFLEAITAVDIEKDRKRIVNGFRQPNMLITDITHFQYVQERKIKEVQSRISEIDSSKNETHSLVFKKGRTFLEESFGILKINEFMAYSLNKEIVIWDWASNKYVATLEGHSLEINCLETIDENRFASGSQDKTIKIWDAKSYTCLKTLTVPDSGVCSLNSLTPNEMASGLWGDIKIWDIESGECLKTLKGHSKWINSCICLSNGNLVSCSDDKTIKVWNLSNEKCIETLIGHSNCVYCIFLLKNGQLASGSHDKTIKLWNVESVESTVQ